MGGRWAIDGRDLPTRGSCQIYLRRRDVETKPWYGVCIPNSLAFRRRIDHRRTDRPQEVSLLVSTEGLHALTDMALATKEQARLDQLLAQNGEGTITAEGLQELDSLLKKIDELNLVKARAAVALDTVMKEG